MCTSSITAQRKGFLTTAFYVHAKVFVDHDSKLNFISLMRTLTSAETVRANRMFEAHAYTILEIRINSTVSGIFFPLVHITE